MAESNNSKSNKITLKIYIPEDPSVQATLSPVDGEKNKLDCLERNRGAHHGDLRQDNLQCQHQ